VVAVLLSLEQGKFLVKLARQAIETALKSNEVISPPAEVDEILESLAVSS